MNGILKNIIFEQAKENSNYYSKHFHDTYTLGITYEGFLKTYNQNKRFDYYVFSTRITNPGEVHEGTSSSWSHVNFYPTIELFSEVYQDLYSKKEYPLFLEHNIFDEVLYYKLHNFFLSVSKNEDKLKIETLLYDTLVYLVKNYASSSKKIDEKYFDEKRVVKNTYEFIKDSLDSKFTLEMLAKNSSMSKYHFLRIFKKEFGLTPHSFIINERINKAEKLIKNGMNISEASLEVGFNDQSHFTRNFKKLYGYTPATLQKKKNIIL